MDFLLFIYITYYFFKEIDKMPTTILILDINNRSGL